MRFPGLATLLAFAMLFTQAFAAPFLLSPTGSLVPFTTPAMTQSPHQPCGDVAAACGHPVDSHGAVCSSAAECAAMHGWVGVFAQIVPMPGPLAASYSAARMLSYIGSATVPPIPPPRHVV